MTLSTFLLQIEVKLYRLRLNKWCLAASIFRTKCFTWKLSNVLSVSRVGLNHQEALVDYLESIEKSVD